MKILFLSKDFTYNGGGERMLANLANSLSKKYQISVVSLDYSDNQSLYTLDNNIDFIKANIRKRKINFLTKFDYIHWLKKNKSIISKYDIVIGVGIIMNLILSMTSIKPKKIAWEHSSYINVPVYQKILRFIFFKKLDAVVELTFQDYEKYKKLNNNTHVIYNFSKMPIIKRDAIVKKNFIWIGRLSEMKGIEYLKIIIKKFCSMNTEWNFRIIGNGEAQESFFEYIEKEKLQDRISYDAISTTIMEELDNSGGMLMTSLAEGLPMVLIEAQTRGLPVISFDTETGPREIIEDGISGFIIDCYNVDKFCAKMFEYVNNTELRNQMALDSYNASMKFSEERIVSQWINLLEDL